MSLNSRFFAMRILRAVGLAALAGSPVSAQPFAQSVARADVHASIPFSEAQVQSADGQVFDVSWSSPASAGEVVVYASDALSADGSLQAPRQVGHGPASGHMVIRNLPSAVRWYFELRPARGDALIVADRSLHLTSAPNFRDIGGYRTQDGRWVKMGLAYRSDQLNRLSDADFAKLERLAPSLIIDLRTQSERAAGPDRLPGGAGSRVDDVLGDDPLIGGALRQASGPAKAIELMTGANRTFVSSPSAKAAYARLLGSDLQTPAVVVYHCTAGKDRTGWGTAVLLTLLGVPRERVMTDYLKSNFYLVDKNKAAYAAMSPVMAQTLEPVLTVRSAYLQAAFDEVDLRFGSFSNYVHNGLGLDNQALAKLRARFLAGEL